MSRRISLIYLLLAAATTALAVTLFLTLNVLSDELNKQQHKYRESLVWNVSQLEREGMFFLQQLLLYGRDEGLAAGESVQQAFDIFWSRTETLRRGQAGRLAMELGGRSDSERLLAEIGRVLERCDPLVTRIVDGERSLVQKVYLQFRPLMLPIHHFVQNVGNGSMRIQEGDRRRFLDLKWNSVWLLLASFFSGTLLAVLLLTRERALNRLRDSLESQVARRTGELSKANLALSDEVERHRRARDEMRALRTLLQDIVSLMPSQLVGVDGQGVVMLWNRQAELASGIAVADAVGKPLSESLPGLARWLADSQEALARGCPVYLHRNAYPTENSDTLVDIVAYPLLESERDGVVIRIDDITARAKLDEHMIHSEKMVSIGGLAAGMAHEINNPLAGIVQNLQVIEQRLDPAFDINLKVARDHAVSLEGMHRYFEERKLPKLFSGIRESTQKAVKIVHNLQAFSRRDSGGFSCCAVPDLLGQALALVKNDYQVGPGRDFGEIAIVHRYADGLPLIACQPGLLQQVFFNILKNAVQALALVDDPGRTPTITLAVEPRGDAVRIEIGDNGPGMDEAVKKRIFEPFFTTKEVGAGTGLGLSVAYMIVCEKHGGRLEVESTVGEGSRLVITIPRARKRAEEGGR